MVPRQSWSSSRRAGVEEWPAFFFFFFFRFFFVVVVFFSFVSGFLYASSFGPIE